MALDDFRKDASALQAKIDDSVESLSSAAQEAQRRISKAAIKAINKFELVDGRFVANQDYAARILALEQQFNKILGDVYQPAVKEYLSIFKTIEETTVGLQKSYNALKVDIDLLTPQRRLALDTAQNYLNSAIRYQYVQPAKLVMAQQVISGAGITETVALLESWYTEEELLRPSTTVRGVANLRKYATQIARDSAFKFQGTINEKIAQEYGLTKFIYVGGIIGDSREFCKHLVGLKRKISLDEVPKLIAQYPQGTYPETTKKNFIAVCGGYNCRHSAQPVRD